MKSICSTLEQELVSPRAACRGVGLLVTLFAMFFLGLASTARAQTADLTISKSGPATVTAGTNITYTVTVASPAGPQASEQATLTDALPPGTSFVSETHDAAWSCTTPGVGLAGAITCTTGVIQPGQSFSFTFVFDVGSNVACGTILTNTATISHTGPDPNLSNNTSSTSATVMSAVDTTPPSITCPANITVTSGGAGATGTVVTYPAPQASDNCSLMSVVCTPPSGSTFSAGTTTVTCTATDTAGNPATCSFSVTVFSSCLQDDSNAGNVVLFNLSTGEYRFCCGGVVSASGIGTVSGVGSTFTIQHYSGDRRVLIKVDFAAKRGTASLQKPPGTIKCTIMDRDISNNSCACAPVM